MSDKTESISIQDNKLKAVTSNSRLGRFEFDKELASWKDCEVDHFYDDELEIEKRGAVSK